jgi:hypothetical protein
MMYEIEVRPGPNTGFFNYYTETVEANTSHDAVARVQRANPGCQVRCCNSYNKSQNGNSSIPSVGNVGGGAALVGLIVGGWVFITFTPWIMMGLGGAIGTFIGEKVTGQSIEEYTERDDDSGHGKAAIALVLALLAGGFGFVQGTNLQKEWNNSNTPAEVRTK